MAADSAVHVQEEAGVGPAEETGNQADQRATPHRRKSSSVATEIHKSSQSAQFPPKTQHNETLKTNVIDSCGRHNFTGVTGDEENNKYNKGMTRVDLDTHRSKAHVPIKAKNAESPLQANLPKQSALGQDYFSVPNAHRVPDSMTEHMSRSLYLLKNNVKMDREREEDEDRKKEQYEREEAEEERWGEDAEEEEEEEEEETDAEEEEFEAEEEQKQEDSSGDEDNEDWKPIKRNGWELLPNFLTKNEDDGEMCRGKAVKKVKEVFAASPKSMPSSAKAYKKAAVMNSGPKQTNATTKMILNNPSSSRKGRKPELNDQVRLLLHEEIKVSRNLAELRTIAKLALRMQLRFEGKNQVGSNWYDLSLIASSSTYRFKWMAWRLTYCPITLKACRT